MNKKHAQSWSRKRDRFSARNLRHKNVRHNAFHFFVAHFVARFRVHFLALFSRSGKGPDPEERGGHRNCVLVLFRGAWSKAMRDHAYGVCDPRPHTLHETNSKHNRCTIPTVYAQHQPCVYILDLPMLSRRRLTLSPFGCWRRRKNWCWR